MNVTTAAEDDHPQAASACQRSSVQLPLHNARQIPGRLPDAVSTPMYSTMFGSASTPTEQTSAQAGDPVRIDHPQRVVHVSERPALD